MVSVYDTTGKAYFRVRGAGLAQAVQPGQHLVQPETRPIDVSVMTSLIQQAQRPRGMLCRCRDREVDGHVMVVSSVDDEYGRHSFRARRLHPPRPRRLPKQVGQRPW